MTGKAEELPKKIKSIRQHLKLSQEELAHKLGVSFTSVNRWENGQTKPSKLARKQLEALCKECGYEMPVLL
ncbi:MAG: transcriptional regulator [Parachlamydia sp.]|nr:MAG: transcriptional regulator [Parachlamydia sp.]